LVYEAALMALRLAILTHEYYPVLSGGTVFTEKMAEELTRLGYDVEILTARIGKDQPLVETASGFRVLRFPTARRSVSDSTLLEHLGYFGFGTPQMIRRALGQRYDLLFSVFAIPSGLMALGIAKALGVPSVVFVDAADCPGVESAMKSYVRHLTKLFGFVVNRSDGVVVLDGLQDLALPHIQHDRTTIIPNGATLPERVAEPGSHGSTLELLSIGRLVLRKGFGEILAALGLVREKRSDFRLKIVGYGRAEDEIRRVLDAHRIADNVEFVGRVEYSKLAPYYLGADAYLFYGDREGSSLAMIEAAAHGLPLVVSDHPGNRTYVEHGRSGLLVEHKNPRALADAILHLLENRGALAQMGAESRAIAERYTWRRIAERYDEFFREILSRRGRGQP
jgi:glycosyltransferase involved in cell wall biosynthesis